jgi:hypothetical protein
VLKFDFTELIEAEEAKEAFETAAGLEEEEGKDSGSEKQDL